MDAPKPPEKLSSNLAADLEAAMHRILSRCRFEGPGSLGVSWADEAYLLAIVDLDAARIIARFLGTLPYLSINSDPVVWTLSPEQAREIIASSH